jgi:prophage regulatory protein
MVRNMAQLIRLRRCLEKSGDTRSPWYAKVLAGLMTRPVKTGSGRAVAWPEHELDAIINARIAGASDDEIRKLVGKLHAARKLAVQQEVAAWPMEVIEAQEAAWTAAPTDTAQKAAAGRASAASRRAAPRRPRRWRNGRDHRTEGRAAGTQGPDP